MKLILPAAAIIISYFFASIPWGLIIGKINGIDIREHGSGNIGATNVRRVLGKLWGRVCFLLDFLKGFLPIIILTKLIAKEVISDPWHVVLALTALACVAGHMWSIYLGFKGGKGISTTAGILLALAPYSLIVAGVTWVVVFYAFRYVSLASIAASIVLPVMALIFSQIGLQKLETPVLVLLFLLAALAIFRHRSNIQRLLAGTENRFDKKKPKEAK